MIILPMLTTLGHFSLKGWENVLFELGNERVNECDDDSWLSSHSLTQNRGDRAAEQRMSAVSAKPYLMSCHSLSTRESELRGDELFRVNGGQLASERRV